MILKLKDWSTTPGGRSRSSGKHSAEEFYEEVLNPAMLKANEQGEMLIVDLDGTAGIASSFINEAFGRLTLDFSQMRIRIGLVIMSNEDPNLKADVWAAIDEWEHLGPPDNSPLKKIKDAR
jgi:hypothetical protein